MMDCKKCPIDNQSNPLAPCPFDCMMCRAYCHACKLENMCDRCYGYWKIENSNPVSRTGNECEGVYLMRE